MPSRKPCRTPTGQFTKCPDSKRSKSKKTGSKKSSKRSKSKHSKQGKKRSKSAKKSKNGRKKTQHCRSARGRFSPCSERVPTAPSAPRMEGDKTVPGYNFMGSKLQHCIAFTTKESCKSKPRCSWYSFNNTCNPASKMGPASVSAARRKAALSLGVHGDDYVSPCTAVRNDESKCKEIKGCEWKGAVPYCQDKTSSGWGIGAYGKHLFDYAIS